MTDYTYNHDDRTIEKWSEHFTSRIGDDLANLIRPGGVAVIATTHTPDENTGFTLARLPGQRIGEAEFNQ